MDDRITFSFVDLATFYTDIGHKEIIAPDIANLPFMAGINSNCEQKRVVLSCSRNCTVNMDKPSITLVQVEPKIERLLLK